jgi:hypothetical protein
MRKKEAVPFPSVSRISAEEIITREGTTVHHSATETPPSSAEVKTVLVSEFARRFRLDQIEENRLRRLLGPVAKEIDLLRNAGR